MRLFRGVEKGDESLVQDVVRVVLESYGLGFNPQVEDLDLTDFNKYYLDNGGHFEVLEVEGKIVGSFGLYKLDDSTCELRKMYLHTDYQGKGYGREMMERALELAPSLGFKTITLQTNSVLYKAVDMYRKFGFEDFEDPELCDRCDIAMKLNIK
ncbi:MAG: GNAT family N-acetyltransferase [Clostridium sp.]